MLVSCSALDMPCVPLGELWAQYGLRAGSVWAAYALRVCKGCVWARARFRVPIMSKSKLRLSVGASYLVYMVIFVFDVGPRTRAK